MLILIIVIYSFSNVGNDKKFTLRSLSRLFGKKDSKSLTAL